MSFQPLLPGDDASIGDRTSALGEWCQGFLYGLGTGVGGCRRLRVLQGEAAEVVRDMTEITHVDVDPDDDPESNEAAYAELVEFVRVGVQLLYEHLQPLREPVPHRHAGNPALKTRAPGSAAVAARAVQLKAGNASSRAAGACSSRLMGRNGIAILPAALVRHRNNDVEHPYRQDSDFHYLTGFDEPEAVAVLVPGREAAEYILFVRDRDPLRETWDGRRAGPDGAVERHAADDAFPISDMDEILPGLMENRERVYYAMGTIRSSTSACWAGWPRCAARRRDWASIRRRKWWRSTMCCTTCGSTRAASRPG